MTYTKEEYAVLNEYTLDLFQSITSGKHTEKQYRDFVAKRESEHTDKDQKRWDKRFHSVWQGSLKRVPLFINDPDDTIRGIVKARMIIGR